MSHDSSLEPPENYARDSQYITCEDCDGKGKIQNPDYDGQTKGVEQEVECWYCDGRGEQEVPECDSCGHIPCSCDEQYDAWSGK